MMKITLFALAVLAVAFAQEDAPAPAAGGAAPVQILKQVDEQDVDKYSFEFETSDGTSRQETGEYKNDTEQQGLVVRGSYKYVAPDGQHISVTYIADKDGYQPTEEKAADQAATGQTATGQAAADQPAANQAAAYQAAADQPAADQAATDQPAADQSAADQSTAPQA